MPLAKYNAAFGGKPGSAEEAHAAMLKQYGAKKGESVFYATKNSRMKSHMPKGAPVKGDWGDVGLQRQREAAALGGFTSGHDVSAAKEFTESPEKGLAQ